MGSDEVTLKVLIEIRDELRSQSGRIDQTNARLDQTNARLELMREDLGSRIVESELRTATAINGLAGTLRDGLTKRGLAAEDL